MVRRLSAILVVSVTVLNGCSGEKKASAAQPSAKKEGSVPPRPTVVGTPAKPYRSMTVTGGARLTGTVDFDGPFPSDSIALTADHTDCGQTVTNGVVERTGSRVGGVVVWLTDIRSGKPLPIERRFELANEDCAFTPRIQAVVAPATLNIASEDVAMHRNRVINVGTGEVEAIAPFNDNGEVIPFDNVLDKVEQLEVVCDQHPWSKAWIIALDHPYYSVSTKNGAFNIEDIPAGTYMLRAWHPLLGMVDQSVTLAAGQAATLTLRIPP